MEKSDPILPTRDTLMVRLQQLRNPCCKSAPTVLDRSKRVEEISIPNECISKRQLRTHRTVRGANPTLYARKKLSGLFEKFPKVQLEKKRGGIPAQDAEH